MAVGLSDGSNYADEGAWMAATMPLGSSTEPAGALKSQPGTQVAPQKINAVQPSNELPNIEDVPHHDWVENLFKTAKEAFQLPGEVFGGKVDPTSTQGIEKAMDLAGLMVFGPAPVAAKMAEGTLGSFMGVRSKTLDKTKLYKAQNQTLEGVHPDDIWHDTGTFQGADGRWRQEISDKDSKLNEAAFNKDTIPNDPRTGGETNTTFSLKDPVNNGVQVYLEDALHHPELYKAYPFLKGVKLNPLRGDDIPIGSANILDNRISLRDDLDPSFIRSVLLHEVQHFIQDYEGFASGANSKAFKDIAESPSAATTLYKRVKGEVEARNVQARMNFDNLSRRVKPPLSTEDVPRFLQKDAPSK